MSQAPLVVAAGVTIPGDELIVTAARSGGPGGQNVNKVESKVILRFDVRASRALGEAQRELLLGRLAARLTRRGELVLHCSSHREQRRNAEDARERLAAMLRAALAPRVRRKKTRPSRASGEKRLRGKRSRSEVKRGRGRPVDE